LQPKAPELNMAEVLRLFTDTIEGGDGVLYRAQACGAPGARGLWEGWIEFIPADGSAAIRSPRETTQPNKADAAYWADGLTRVYLEGALQRANNRHTRSEPLTPAESIFDSPAAARAATVSRAEAPASAILDPFSVFSKGEALLRRELGALSAWHLVNIAVSYELGSVPVAELQAMPAPAIIDVIVSGVKERSTRRRRA
jgi:hypothetical protein